MTAIRRLVLDLALLVSLLVAYRPSATGLAVHEWLGIAFAAPILVHLVINWDWVTRVADSALEKLRTASWVNFVLDVLLFVSTITVLLSGIMVSSSVADLFGSAAGMGGIWSVLHSISADVVVAMALLHLAMHWKWVVRVSRRLVATVWPRPDDEATVVTGVAALATPGSDPSERPTPTTR